MFALEVKGIDRSAGGVRILDDVSFTVDESEFFSIVGPLGAGKTSLLRCIAGLDSPDSGEVALAGQDVTRTPANRRSVSMFFENLSLYPHKSGFENLAFPLRRQRVPSSELRQQVAEIADILGIGHILKRRPGTYSGGERQRLALGRTLVRPARVYLLDEPLTNLDALLRVHMRSELKRLQRDLGHTIVCATSDPLEALAIADRVCVLSEGRIQQIADPLTLYRKPANRMVAGFVGNPPINFIPATIERTNGRVVARAGGLELDLTGRWPSEAPAPTGATTLGVRPEDIALTDPDDAGATAQVFALEPLGRKTVVDLMLENVLVKVLVRGPARLEVGADLRLVVNVERVHVIDDESGRVVL